MLPRRRVKIVTPQHVPEDETWAKINGFPEVLKLGMNEAQFQDLCEDIAARYGWTVYHETDSRKSPQGLPDLLMLSPLQPDGSVVLAMLELKTEKGKLTEAQLLWQMKLGKVDRLVTGVLRPSGWQAFVNLCFDPQGSTAVDPHEEGVPTDG
jgi:hypothetical protein